MMALHEERQKREELERKLREETQLREELVAQQIKYREKQKQQVEQVLFCQCLITYLSLFLTCLCLGDIEANVIFESVADSILSDVSELL